MLDITTVDNYNSSESGKIADPFVDYTLVENFSFITHPKEPGNGYILDTSGEGGSTPYYGAGMMKLKLLSPLLMSSLVLTTYNYVGHVSARIISSGGTTIYLKGSASSGNFASREDATISGYGAFGPVVGDRTVWNFSAMMADILIIGIGTVDNQSEYVNFLDKIEVPEFEPFWTNLKGQTETE